MARQNEVAAQAAEPVKNTLKPKHSYKTLAIYLAVIIFACAVVFAIIYGVSVAKSFY